MDATTLYPRGFHPAEIDMLPDLSGPAPVKRRKHTRAKYYFIDFSSAVHISDGAPSKLVEGWARREIEVPELPSTKPYNPFKVDVFRVGDIMRRLAFNVSNLPTHVGPLLNSVRTEIRWRRILGYISV